MTLQEISIDRARQYKEADEVMTDTTECRMQNAECGTKYSGAEWVKSALDIKDMSHLGEVVADLLGDTFLGIYHLSSRSLKKIDWANNRWISFVYYGGLASVDGNELMRLIVLAHDRMLRVEIDGAANKYLRITFHQRHKRSGGEFWDQCPTLDDHISKIRKHYGSVSLDEYEEAAK